MRTSADVFAHMGIAIYAIVQSETLVKHSSWISHCCPQRPAAVAAEAADHLHQPSPTDRRWATVDVLQSCLQGGRDY